MWRKLTASPVKFFVVFGALFGLLFLIITPPFQTPDESYHFYRSYQISTGNPTVDILPENTGGLIPYTVVRTVVETMRNPSVQFRPDVKYDIYKVSDAFEHDGGGELRPTYFATTAFNTPIAYGPQTVGIMIGRLLDLPPILWMYLGRIANLVTWLILISFAIRAMPGKKWAVVFIGLLPMSIAQAASLSADVLGYGMIALLAALVFKYANILYTSKILSPYQLGLLFVLPFLITLTKQGVAVFSLLILLLPQRVFQNRKIEIAFKSLALIVPAVLLAAWLSYVARYDLTATYTNFQDPELQLDFVSGNPHSFINVLWNTYFFSWGDSIARSLIGTFGWSDAPLSLPIVIFGYIAMFLVFIARVASDKISLEKWQKIGVVIISILYFLAVSIGLYMYYSPVEFKIIVGLQGRYFIPLLFLAIPLLSRFKLIEMKKLAYKRVATLTPIFLLVCSLITIYVRYYVNNV